VKNSARPIEWRIFRGTTIASIAFLVSTARAIILVPILLRNWGPEIYGVWLALFALYTLLQTLDTGHHNFLGNEFNKHYVHDKEHVKRLLGSGMRAAVALGLAQFVVACALVGLGLLPKICGVAAPLASKEGIDSAFLVLVATWMFFGSVQGLYGRLFISLGQFERAQWWNIVLTSAQLAAVVFASLGRAKLSETVFAFVLATIAVTAFFIRDVKVTLKEFEGSLFSGTWQMGWSNLQKSSVLTVTGLVQQLANNGVVLVVSSAVSLAAVPVFATARTLSNVSLQGTSLLVQPLFVEITRFHARREPSKLVSSFVAFWFVAGLSVNTAIIIIAPCARALYEGWTSKRIAFDAGLTYLLFMAVAMQTFGAPLNAYLFATNHLRSQAVMTAARAAIAIAGGFILGRLFGVAGIALALVGSEICSSIIFPLLYVNRELRELGGKLAAMEAVMAGAPMVILALALASFYQWEQFKPLTACFALPLLWAAYLAQWFMLPDELRIRLRSVVDGMLRLVGFSRAARN